MQLRCVQTIAGTSCKPGALPIAAGGLLHQHEAYPMEQHRSSGETLPWQTVLLQRLSFEISVNADV